MKISDQKSFEDNNGLYSGWPASVLILWMVSTIALVPTSDHSTSFVLQRHYSTPMDSGHEHKGLFVRL